MSSPSPASQTNAASQQPYSRAAPGRSSVSGKQTGWQSGWQLKPPDERDELTTTYVTRPQRPSWTQRRSSWSDTKRSIRRRKSRISFARSSVAPSNRASHVGRQPSRTLSKGEQDNRSNPRAFSTLSQTVSSNDPGASEGAALTADNLDAFNEKSAILVETEVFQDSNRRGTCKSLERRRDSFIEQESKPSGRRDTRRYSNTLRDNATRGEVTSRSEWQPDDNVTTAARTMAMTSRKPARVSSQSGVSDSLRCATNVMRRPTAVTQGSKSTAIPLEAASSTQTASAPRITAYRGSSAAKSRPSTNYRSASEIGATTRRSSTQTAAKADPAAAVITAAAREASVSKRVSTTQQTRAPIERKSTHGDSKRGEAVTAQESATREVAVEETARDDKTKVSSTRRSRSLTAPTGFAGPPVPLGSWVLENSRTVRKREAGGSRIVEDSFALWRRARAVT